MAHRNHTQTLSSHLRVAPISLPSLVVLTFLLVFAAYQFMTVVKIVVGPRDTRFISNTHELEPLEDTNRWMRWTTNQSHVTLPLAAAHQPLIFDLNIMNHYPHTLADHPEIDLFMGDELLLHFIPSRESRHYRILLPPQERFGWGVPFTIHSTTVMPPTDERNLGAVLVQARLIPISGFPTIPPIWQITAALIGVIATYITLRGIGASHLIAWILALILAIIWAYILARWPMQVAPFTMRLAGLCTLAALYGSSVILLKDTPAWVSLPRLIIMMGVAYWLMPVYQLVMTIDGVNGVSPYPPTLWAGGATILASGIGMGILTLRGQLHQWEKLILAILALAAVARLIIMLEFVMDNIGVAAICIIVGFGVVAASRFLSRGQLALTTVVALAVVIGAAAQFDPWSGRSGPDFWILFKGAREWYRGGSMYNIPGIIENHFGHSFKVPPFYGMLFLPFVEKDGLEILFWHRIINMLLVSLILFIMLRGFGTSLFTPLGAGLVMLFNMRPLADTVAYGQIDIMLLLLLTVALVAAQRRYDGLAGAAIALATLFKLYPVLMLAFFLAKRQWRVLVGFIIGMLIYNGIAIAVVGWEMHYVYLFDVIPRIRGGTSWVENQTLNGFLSRLFAPNISATIFEHPLVMLLTYAGFGVTAIGATLLALLPAERQTPRYMLQYSLFVILLVLVVPAAWMHYQTVTILTFACLLVFTRQAQIARWRAALLGGSYALIAYGNQWSYYLNDIMGGLTVMGVSFKFYGLLLLLAVTVGGILNHTSSESPS